MTPDSLARLTTEDFHALRFHLKRLEARDRLAFITDMRIVMGQLPPVKADGVLMELARKAAGTNQEQFARYAADIATKAIGDGRQQ